MAICALGFSVAYGGVLKNNELLPINHFIIESNKSKKVGSCEQEAINALNAAFALSQSGNVQCVNIHPSGGVGLTECFHYVTAIREAMIQIMYYNYANCTDAYIFEI